MQSIFSKCVFCFHRFDEFDISPLTIKALKSAGYVRMTRVQEAALSVVLDGISTPPFCGFEVCYIVTCLLNVYYYI